MTLLAALVLGALAAPPQAAPPQGAPRPRLHVENPEVDFGALFQGEARTRAYRLENRGDAPLVVDRIKPNCGCASARVLVGEARTEVGLDKNALIGGTPIFVLQPGEFADLEVTYDATGQPPRAMTKHVLLGTNDPDHLRFTLTLQVRVRLALQVYPRPVQFGDVPRGEGARKEVLLQVAAGLDLAVESVENTDDVFAAELEEIEAHDGARRYRVRVSVRPDAPIGNHGRTLAALTDHATLSQVNIPVFANVHSAVRFDTGNPTHESTLSFGLLPRGERSTRTIEVRNTDPAVPYTPLGVDVDSRWKDQLDVEVREVEAGRHYRILVSTKPDLDTRFFTGTLTVRADHPDLPSKVVLFNGRFAPPLRGG